VLTASQTPRSEWRLFPGSRRRGRRTQEMGSAHREWRRTRLRTNDPVQGIRSRCVVAADHTRRLGALGVGRNDTDRDQGKWPGTPHRSVTGKSDGDANCEGANNGPMRKSSQAPGSKTQGQTNSAMAPRLTVWWHRRAPRGSAGWVSLLLALSLSPGCGLASSGHSEWRR